MEPQLIFCLAILLIVATAISAIPQQRSRVIIISEPDQGEGSTSFLFVILLIVLIVGLAASAIGIAG